MKIEDYKFLLDGPNEIAEIIEKVADEEMEVSEEKLQALTSVLDYFERECDLDEVEEIVRRQLIEEITGMDLK
jgi:hypothetical protein